MSHKAFYQTFFQTEQLFRRTDDVLTFPPLTESTTQLLAIETEMPEAGGSASVQEVVAVAPTVRISDPVYSCPRRRAYRGVTGEYSSAGGCDCTRS
jgi:hypothetical protein